MDHEQRMAIFGDNAVCLFDEENHSLSLMKLNKEQWLLWIMTYLFTQVDSMVSKDKLISKNCSTQI